MQAIILAGGEGKRLRPFTDAVPKPMIPVGGRPILEYTLGIVPKEVDEAILVIGYRGAQIKEYFGDSFKNIKIRYVEQPEPKGTADAMMCAAPHIKGDEFFLLYGDDLYHPDDLRASLGKGPVVLVKESAHPERFGVCIVDGEGMLKDVLEKQEHPPSNLVNIGAYILHTDIFNVPQVRMVNGEYNLAAQIGVWAKTRPVRTVRARFWHPIGYPDDLSVAEHYLKLPFSQCVN